MSRSKGILGKLFSRGDQRSDETSSTLTPSQKVELRNTLKSEYGIEILHTDLTRTDLMQNGYRKMASDELVQTSMVLQYIPQFAALAVNNGQSILHSKLQQQELSESASPMACIWQHPN